MKTRKLFIAVATALSFATTANAFTTQPYTNNAPANGIAAFEEPSNEPSDEVPQYPGGTKAMYDFIYKNMNFPAADKKKGVSGIVVVRFIVEKNGSLSNVEVIKHGTPSMDKEVIRVVKKMQKWIPAKKNGKPVAVSMALPINFKSI